MLPTFRPRATIVLATLFLLPASACAPEGGPSGQAGGDEGSAEAASPSAAGPAPAERCGELASTLGSPGTTAGDVCKVTFPRADLEVALRGATLPPGMGMTSWAAFGPAGERGAIVMGDLALTSDELPAVMAGLREHGIRVTAVHRHMLGESPTMSYMHYLGVGPADSLAAALDAALRRAPSARGADREGVSGPPAAATTGEAGRVAGTSCESLARTLGTDPAAIAAGPGYCKVSRPRTDLDVTVEGIPVPASMGVGSWFAFRETAGGDAAVVTGDMALTQEQVNPAIRALREESVEVVALHNHMLHDEPRVMFFHFQARGAPAELAGGLRAGLEAAGLVGGG
jgi:hypothetical protein